MPLIRSRPFDEHHLAFALGRPHRRANLFLDPLGGALADQQIIIAPDERDDRLVHLVPAHAHARRVGDSPQRQNRDLGRPAADIHHHRTDGLGHRHPRADRGRHRLLDQIHLARARIRRRVADRTPLHLGRSARHADHDLGVATELAAVHLLDEVVDHLLGDIDVGDHAVAQWPDRLDIARRAAHHHFRVIADRAHDLLAAHRLNRNHARLVQHDAATANIRPACSRCRDRSPYPGRGS